MTQIDVNTKERYKQVTAQAKSCKLPMGANNIFMWDIC